MKKHSQFAVLLLPLLAIGCGHAVDLSKGVLINQNDSSQVLVLTVDPSQTTNLMLRAAIETGATKFIGKTVGVYQLKISGRTSNGRFIALKSFRSDISITFNPDSGVAWTLTGTPDGSFTDTSGSVWRLKL